MIAALIIWHVFGVLIWVGGMFFAHMVLRPVAVAQFEPPQRLQLWQGIFRRFFIWVWFSVISILISGIWLIIAKYQGVVPVYIHIMSGIGLLMMLIFTYIFFFPYARLQKEIAAQNWSTAAQALARIRILVMTNLILGLLTSFIASSGIYWS